MRNNTTDGSNDNEAVKIVKSLKPFVKKWFSEWGGSCMRRKKMTVTTAPNSSTGLIGVTDAFSGTEVFIKYMSCCSNATVGDTVWCNWMYDNMQTLYADSMGDLNPTVEYVPKSGGEFTGNVKFGGVVDIIQRRAQATLSSAGWYNIIKFSAGSSTGVRFATGTSVRIQIGTSYVGTNNSVHEVTMLGTYNTNPRFSSEVSRSNVNVIDKIRYRYDANNVGWIDVHYSPSASNNAWMKFDVGYYDSSQYRWTSQPFTAVDDAPSTGGTADTILTTHEFLAASGSSISFTPTTGSAYSSYGNCWYAKDGNIVEVHVGISGLTASTSTTIFTLPVGFRPKSIYVTTGNGSAISNLARMRIGTDGTVTVYSASTTALLDGMFICAL